MKQSVTNGCRFRWDVLVLIALLIGAAGRPTFAATDIESLKQNLEPYPVPTLLKLRYAKPKVQAAFVPELMHLIHQGEALHRIRARHILRDLAASRPDRVAKAYAGGLFEARDDVETVCQITVDELQRMGAAADAAVPVLIDGIEQLERTDHNRTITQHAVRALGNIGEPAAPAAPLLATLLRADDPAMRKTVLNALQRIGPDSAEPVEPLMEIIADASSDLRVEAIHTLATIGPGARGAVAELVRIGDKETGAVYEAVRAALPQIKTEDALPHADDLTVQCTEGKSVTVKLPASDSDDLARTLAAEIVSPPSRGSLQQVGPLRFAYRAQAGAPAADTFRWRVVDPTGNGAIATATIKLTPDRQPPKLADAYAMGRRDEVMVVFDEPVAAASATDAERYRIDNGVTIEGATMRDARTVILQTSPLSEGVAYTVTADRIADRSTPANTLSNAQRELNYADRRPHLTQERGDVPTARLADRAGRDIHLDGKLDDPFWQEQFPSDATGKLKAVATGAAPAFATDFKVAWADGDLYVAVRCKDFTKQTAYIRAHEDGDRNIWYGDCIEIVLETQVHSYYQIAVSPAGAVVDLDRAGGGLNFDWSSDAEAAAHIGDGYWSVEVRIPVKSPTQAVDAPLDGIAGWRPSEQQPWHFNVQRQWRRSVSMRDDELTAFSPTGQNGFHVPSQFATLY